ncbi:hypothetical protein UFOVP844_33 [uncultured Caudovirales phage]|uniref:Uncharacterized protein n=1 Tax=uncultured Caudovirales phage TaxID=2100421 RepID=A0A6J5PB95_9CAUD|nr:hypothetical protein UFOVP844_33 [uncultured Caudovirales phage]
MIRSKILTAISFFIWPFYIYIELCFPEYLHWARPIFGMFFGRLAALSWLYEDRKNDWLNAEAEAYLWKLRYKAIETVEKNKTAVFKSFPKL